MEEKKPKQFFRTVWEAFNTNIQKQKVALHRNIQEQKVRTFGLGLPPDTLKWDKSESYLIRVRHDPSDDKAKQLNEKLDRPFREKIKTFTTQLIETLNVDAINELLPYIDLLNTEQKEKFDTRHEFLREEDTKREDAEKKARTARKKRKTQEKW